MANGILWQKTGGDDATNAEIAASATEAIRFTRAPDPRNFNYLDVVNGSAVAIAILLNGYTTAGSILRIQAGGSAGLEADAGFAFDFVVVRNESAAAVVAASTVQLSVGKFIPVRV